MEHVMIDLDKPRRLRYDSNSIADVEGAADAGIMALMGKERTGFNTVRLLLWGGLKWADRKLTVQQVGKLMDGYFKDGGTLIDLYEKVQEALEESGLFEFKEVDEEDEEGNMEAEAES